MNRLGPRRPAGPQSYLSAVELLSDRTASRTVPSSSAWSPWPALPQQESSPQRAQQVRLHAPARLQTASARAKRLQPLPQAPQLHRPEPRQPGSPRQRARRPAVTLSGTVLPPESAWEPKASLSKAPQSPPWQKWKSRPACGRRRPPRWGCQWNPQRRTVRRPHPRGAHSGRNWRCDADRRRTGPRTRRRTASAGHPPAALPSEYRAWRRTIRWPRGDRSPSSASAPA